MEFMLGSKNENSNNIISGEMKFVFNLNNFTIKSFHLSSILVLVLQFEISRKFAAI
jgi:hypothetical protein